MDLTRTDGPAHARQVRWLYAGLAAALVVFYLASVTPHWIIGRDSAIYLMLGKSLARGDGYVALGQPHGKYPPGYPLLLAALIRLGAGDMFWLNLSSVGIGLATLALTVDLLRRYLPLHLAVWATLAIGLNHTFCLITLSQLSDGPFLCLILTGLWAYGRSSAKSPSWQLGIGTLALIASCWFRVAGIPLVLGAAIGLLLAHFPRPERRIWPQVVLVFLGVGLTAGYLLLQDRRANQNPLAGSYLGDFAYMQRLSAWGWLRHSLTNAYLTCDELAKLFGGQKVHPLVGFLLFGVPILLGIGRAIRLRAYPEVLATGAYLLACWVLMPTSPRYLLPVLPCLMLFLVLGLGWLLDQAARLRPTGSPVSHPGLPIRPGLVPLLAALLFLQAALHIPKDFRLTRALHGSFLEYDKAWPSLHETAVFLRVDPHRSGACFGSTFAGVLAYWGDVPFVETPMTLLASSPSPAQLDRLLQQHGIGTVVIGHRDPPYPFFRQLERFVRTSGHFRVVFSNKDFTVFSRKLAFISPSEDVRLPPATPPEEGHGQPAPTLVPLLFPERQHPVIACSEAE